VLFAIPCNVPLNVVGLSGHALCLRTRGSVYPFPRPGVIALVTLFICNCARQSGDYTVNALNFVRRATGCFNSTAVTCLPL
jgi:hypothetical protein